MSTTRPRPRLASQLILIFIGAILIAKIILVSLLYLIIEKRVEPHEKHETIGNIVSVYRNLEGLPATRWEEVLRFAQTSDIKYWVSETPKALDELDNHSKVELFETHAPGVRVQKLEVYGESELTWRLFGPDLEDTCFRDVETPAFNPACPYRVFSLQMSNGDWLNASTDHEPEFVFILIPVSVSAVLVLFFLVIAAVFIVHRVSKPLRDLAESAERLGRGEIVGGLPVKGPREVASLTASFNTMQERLVRFVQDRTRMLGAISHDLRTPITSLRIQTEFIEDVVLRDKMNKTLDDMGRMVRSSLDFARLDTVDDVVEPVDLVEATREVTEEIPDIQFSSSAVNCLYPCRRVGLKRAIRNILENAVTYGTNVAVTLEVEPEQIEIRVCDDGPGIPDNLMEEVFEPFFRADEARNVETGSVGLGLSIARTIVHKHGGSIVLANRSEGLEATVILPR